MKEKFKFICSFRQTVLSVCIGFQQASSAQEGYSRCCLLLPSGSKKILEPFFRALSQENDKEIDKAVDQLWTTFQNNPIIRTFLNLILLGQFMWEERHEICDLMEEIAKLSVRRILFGRLPWYILWSQVFAATRFLTGDRLVGMLFNQLPCGNTGRRLKRLLGSLLIFAQSDSLTQERVVNTGAAKCGNQEELYLFLYLAEQVFL